MLTKEVARLRDKDIRQRRRAVRKLFEDGDPSAMPHFLPFLGDDDEWFVKRALIAIERWYDGSDPRIAESLASSEYNERRLLAARIASRASSPEQMLRKLCVDEDSKIRLAAWSSLIRHDPEIAREGLNSDDRAIRKLSASSIVDSGKITEEDMRAIASDPSSSVRRTLIISHAKNIEKGIHSKVPENILEKVSGSVEDASKEISNSPVSALEKPWVRDLLRSSVPEVITILTSGFRESSWMEYPDTVDSVVEIASDPLLERILRRGKGTHVEAACIKGIMDKRRSEATRSRLVLDRIGRSPSSNFMKALDSVGAPYESELGVAISTLVAEASRSNGGE